MSQAQSAVLYGMNPLIPLYDQHDKRLLPINLPPNTTFVSGTVLGQVAASANDVQTVTMSGSGGTWTFTGVDPISGITFTTPAMAYNIATTGATSLQGYLTAARGTGYGAGNVTVTGTAGSSYVITFGRALAAMPVAVGTLGTGSLTGGSASIAHTTVGVTAGTYGVYNSAVAAVPTTPTVTGTGSGGSWAAQQYLVQITGVNAQGETTPTVPVGVTLTSGQKINIAAISSLDTSFTGLNVYVNAELVGQAAVSAGTSTATAFDIAGVTTKANPPAKNTAYTVPNGAGTQTAKCLLKNACTTDANGNISPNTQSATTGGEWGQTYEVAQAYFSGVFDTSLLTGLDAKAVTDLGRLWYGTTTAGAVRIF